MKYQHVFLAALLVATEGSAVFCHEKIAASNSMAVSTANSSTSTSNATRAIPYSIPEPTIMTHGNWPEFKEKIESAFKARVFRNWAPSKKANDQRVATVKCEMGGDGALYDVEISQSSGDNQFDLECLESVLGADYFYGKHDFRKLIPLSITFTKNSETDHANSPVQTYFEKNVDQKQEGCLAVYKIPVDVLSRYPGVFTESEILSSSNLLIAKDSWNIQAKEQYPWLRGIYRTIWSPFFLQHPKATKEEILAQAALLPK